MKRFFLPSLAFASASALFVACGTSDRPAVFDDAGDPNANDGSTSTGNDGSLFGDAGGGGPAGCVGLECSKPTCSGQNTTTLTGKVFAPNGLDPLYNVLVYVPNADLKPFDDGVTCETCEKSVSGSPIATALTNSIGSFEM